MQYRPFHERNNEQENKDICSPNNQGPPQQTRLDFNVIHCNQNNPKVIIIDFSHNSETCWGKEYNSKHQGYCLYSFEKTLTTSIMIQVGIIHFLAYKRVIIPWWMLLDALHNLPHVVLLIFWLWWQVEPLSSRKDFYRVMHFMHLKLNHLHHHESDTKRFILDLLMNTADWKIFRNFVYLP